jgi:hypothetical protein
MEKKKVMIVLMVILATLTLFAPKFVEYDYLIVRTNKGFYQVLEIDGDIILQDSEAVKVIQYAINSLGKDGGTVHIDNGSYILTETITMNNNIVLYGNGAILQVNENE